LLKRIFSIRYMLYPDEEDTLEISYLMLFGALDFCVSQVAETTSILVT